MAEIPDNALARRKRQEGDACLQTGRLAEARSRYAEACRLDPGDARGWLMLGNLSAQLGASGEAESAYREAVDRDPDLGEAHQFLGNTLAAQGRYAEAAACYRRALRIKPHSIPAHINLANTLLLEGRLEEALDTYRGALHHDPGCRKARVGIAHVHERQGNIQEAYVELQPFLEEGDIDVDVAVIFASLCRPLGRCKEAAEHLEDLLKRDPPLGDEQRTTVHFRLGRVYDAGGDFAAAFQHFQAANDLKARRWPFNARAHADYIAALMDSYSPERMTRAPRAANDSERPVFIVGMPRSGTSLVEQILASHPAVFGAGELEEMQRIVTDLPSALGTDTSYPQCLQEVTPSLLDELAQRYLDCLGQVAPATAVRVTDKMPANFMHLGLIALLFPKARIIHCVRDPLDTCLSCYFQNFSPMNNYTYRLSDLGHYYRQYRKLMGHWSSTLDMSMMEVPYERLVAHQEELSRELIEFCGLPWDERCLRFHETKRAVATASYEQVRQPLYTRSVARWRHYADHLLPLRRALDGADDEDVPRPRDADTQDLKRQARSRLDAGDPDAAMPLLARAQAHEPGDAELCCLLGIAEARLGRPEQAVAHWRAALSLKPGDAATLNELGTALTDSGQFDEAARCFEAALDAGSGAHAHYYLGTLYTRQLRFDEAVFHYRRALALEPQQAGVHNDLGCTLLHQGEYAQAEAAFREALRLAPDHPNAYLAYVNLGAALLIMNRLEEARGYFQRALELKPDLQRAVAGKANVLQRQGAFEQAYALVQPYLQRGEADANIAQALAGMCRHLGRCAEAVALVEGLLAGEGPSLEPYERVMMHFTLGGLFDAAGEYERAFQQFRLGNTLGQRHFDPRAHERYCDALIDTFTPDFMAAAPRAAHRSERPVFIVGMPRTGTSLVEQILASHPSVFGAGELDDMNGITEQMAACLNSPYPGCVKSLSPEQYEQFAGYYLNRLSELAPASALRVTDKMPANFMHLGLIALLFPEARIIHCMRDPLDTCLSCYFQNFITLAYSYDLSHLGGYYRQYQRLMSHWRKVLDVPMMEIRYEDLVADQEGVSRALVEFCDLEWDERCLHFHETRRPVATASYDQVRQPMYDRSVGRWRHYRQHLGPLRKAMGEAAPTLDADPAP